MRDVSMHVLDIAMNSIKANANLIEITIDENGKYLKLIIKDNGCGMKKDTINKITNPFYTTRTTRKVGLGIPLLSENAKNTGGYLKIDSKELCGTKIEAVFVKSHIDCIPLGDIDETILSLIIMEPNKDFNFKHGKGDIKYELDTREIKTILQEVPINESSVISWLKEDLNNKFI